MAEQNDKMKCGLLKLNDRCLRLILQYVSKVDLANLKESCNELASVANREFQKRDSSILFCEENTDESLKVFRQFGGFLDRIELRYEEMDNGINWGDIFSVINENCSENLKSFALIDGAIRFITKNEIAQFSQKLQNVEEIHLSHKTSIFIDDSDTVSHCVSVRKAIINVALDSNQLLAFIRNNPNLLSLALTKPRYTTLATIVNHLLGIGLDEFGITFFRQADVNYDDLLRLVRLKHLGIHFHNLTESSTIDRLLASMDSKNISLTTLTLSHVSFLQKNIMRLSLITRLKVLKLINCVLDFKCHFNYFLALCGNKNYENITLQYGKRQFRPYDKVIRDNYIDKDHFLQIVQRRTLSGATKCLHLVFNREVYLKSSDLISPTILEANKDIVKLMDPNEKNCEYESTFDFLNLGLL